MINSSCIKRPNTKIVAYSSSDEESLPELGRISLSPTGVGIYEEPTPINVKPSNRKGFRRVIESPSPPLTPKINTKKPSSRKKEIETKIKSSVPKPAKKQLFNISYETVALKQSSNYPTSNLSIIATPMKARKRWSAEETARLKIALKTAVNPQTEEHWDFIARSVGVRTGDECQQQAKKIDWQPTTVCGDKTPKPKVETTSFLNSANRRKSRHSIECANDFFQNKDLSELAELDLDDSLFSSLKTPPEQAKCARKPFMSRLLNDSN